MNPVPANRLASERSAYLRQHAGNPVAWQPWDDEALDEARQHDRPIFLSIGYVSCHWCHVMERESFEDAEVAAFLNAHFTCIKVDREERPDLDAVYMEAVQAMTGSGGWPLSVFLGPDRQPFFGGTYFPRDRFLALLPRIVEAFRDRRAWLAGHAAEVVKASASLAEARPAPPIDAATLGRLTLHVLDAVDRDEGGLAGPMKFPSVPVFDFLLHRYRRTGDAALADAVRTTLSAMASGGLRDHVGGGFHRYCTDSMWGVPHFEKMLYDNALLARLYLEASFVLDEPAFAAVGRETLDFLLTTLRGPVGVFCASLDADSDGCEGAAYTWTPGQLVAVAGPADGERLAAYLDVTPDGPVDGACVPTRREVDPEGNGEALFARWRDALAADRARRPQPFLDRKAITAWNGLALAALGLGYCVLDDDRYRDAAEEAAETLLRTHLAPDGTLARASNDGVPAGPGTLEDYAALAHGLVCLHQATQRVAWAEAAIGLVRTVRDRFRAPGGGFLSTPADADAPLGRRPDLHDGATPSGTSLLLATLTRLGLLTGDPSYAQDARDTIAAQGGGALRFPLAMPGWLDAADRLAGPLRSVVIAGRPGSDGLRALAREFRFLRPLHAVVTLLPDSGADAHRIGILPPVAGKTAPDGVATAWVCEEDHCLPPIRDAAKLREILMEGYRVTSGSSPTAAATRSDQRRRLAGSGVDG